MNRRSLEEDCTFARFERSADQADQRRFAGAVGTDQTENLIAFKRESDFDQSPQAHESVW